MLENAKMHKIEQDFKIVFEIIYPSDNANYSFYISKKKKLRYIFEPDYLKLLRNEIDCKIGD